MYRNILIAAAFSMLVLAGCSSGPATPAAQTNAGMTGVDPLIPAKVITARRMTTAEKAAYDQGIDTQITRLKQVE
ncbi:MAG: hypothetical protein H7327_06300 [Herminiimonas sp.]|nr:hypothetical protein [Herminiimonas sp.]